MTHPTLHDQHDRTTHDPRNDHIDDPLLDEEWLAAPAKRSRGRLILVALLAASVCFLGGAFTQKHYGASTTAAAGGAAGLPDGFPGGGQGFPGGAGGFPGGGTSDNQGQDSQSGTSGSGDAASATEAVIGNVVAIDGDTWTVEDLGGKRHQITVTDDTTITREQTLTGDQVAEGDTVNITGTSTGNKLAADQITLR